MGCCQSRQRKKKARPPDGPTVAPAPRKIASTKCEVPPATPSIKCENANQSSEQPTETTQKTRTSTQHNHLNAITTSQPTGQSREKVKELVDEMSRRQEIDTGDIPRGIDRVKILPPDDDVYNHDQKTAPLDAAISKHAQVLLDGKWRGDSLLEDTLRVVWKRRVPKLDLDNKPVAAQKC